MQAAQSCRQAPCKWAEEWSPLKPLHWREPGGESGWSAHRISPPLSPILLWMHFQLKVWRLSIIIGYVWAVTCWQDRESNSCLNKAAIVQVQIVAVL
eukprot:scaffold149736_cov16-Tisochrysis_lutea.AAC.2